MEGSPIFVDSNGDKDNPKLDESPQKSAEATTIETPEKNISVQVETPIKISNDVESLGTALGLATISQASKVSESSRSKTQIMDEKLRARTFLSSTTRQMSCRTVVNKPRVKFSEDPVPRFTRYFNIQQQRKDVETDPQRGRENVKVFPRRGRENIKIDSQRGRENDKSYKSFGAKVSVSELVDFKKRMSWEETLVYVGAESLDENTLQPSKTYVKDGVNQIRVFKKKCDVERENKLENFKTEIETKIKTDFDKMGRFRHSSDPESVIKVAKELAATHNYTSGKWLISVPWEKVDHFWNLLKQALFNDKLTEQATYIKVYSREESNENPHFRLQNSRKKYCAMVSVMTRDWTNEPETLEVGKRIQDLNPTFILLYKPDIFTTLEIYRGNTLNVRPTIYILEPRTAEGLGRQD